jgi:hypothetical protein
MSLTCCTQNHKEEIIHILPSVPPAAGGMKFTAAVLIMRRESNDMPTVWKSGYKRLIHTGDLTSIAVLLFWKRPSAPGFQTRANLSRLTGFFTL